MPPLKSSVLPVIVCVIAPGTVNVPAIPIVPLLASVIAVVAALRSRLL